MIKFTMTIGPKGQVVIPAVLRKHLKIHPQSKVTITLKADSIIITKPQYDISELFKKTANKSQRQRIMLFDSDVEYDRNMKERQR